MAYSYLTSGHRADGDLGTDGGTSGTFDSTGANLIVVAFGHAADSDIVAGNVTDNKGNTGWVFHGGYEDPGQVQVSLFSHAAPAVGTGHTITLTCTGSNAGIAIASFSGAHATPFDDEDGAAGANVTVISPATGITPSVTDCLIISALGRSGSATLTDPTGFTRTDLSAGATSYNVAMAYKIQTSIVAEDPEWTASSNTRMGTIVASFKPASSGRIWTRLAGPSRGLVG